MTSDVIGAAIDVHRDKGPGFLESIYEWCLTMELELRGHHVQTQKKVTLRLAHFVWIGERANQRHRVSQVFEQP